LENNAVPIYVDESPDPAKIEGKNSITPSPANKSEWAKEPGKNREDVLNEARGEAEIIILKARNEARIISDNARKEIDGLRGEAEEEARGKGYGDGFNKGASEAEALKREAEQTLREARAERDELLSGMEPRAVGLIIKIMEKLLGAAVKINPQIILHLIREGLSCATGSESVRIRVSPDDYTVVQDHFNEIMEFAGSSDAQLVKDASLNPMDCIIETSYGNIDSGLDQQFESLKADLLYTLNGAEA
jgi:flagellar assembly protein FliH